MAKAKAESDERIQKIEAKIAGQDSILMGVESNVMMLKVSLDSIAVKLEGYFKIHDSVITQNEKINNLDKLSEKLGAENLRLREEVVELRIKGSATAVVISIVISLIISALSAFLLSKM